MNPYAVMASTIGTPEAVTLSERLASWHDAMVAHERRLLQTGVTDACGEDCPHAEAHALWSDAVAIFGERAAELRFLRTRALGAPRGKAEAVTR